MLQKKFYIPIIVLITMICLSFTVSQTNADPIWEVHIDVWSINLCGWHGYPDWMSIQWYCYYSEIKEEHKDGHETAIESFEDEWFPSWVNCGQYSPLDNCGYIPVPI